MWSPCTGYNQCNNRRNEPDCAVCQHADQYYNCGKATSPIYIFNYNFNSAVYQIQYLWGVDWRYDIYASCTLRDYTLVFTLCAFLAPLQNCTSHTFFRMTVFTFLEDKTQEETTVEFTGEDPYLQYVSYFVVMQCSRN